MNEIYKPCAGGFWKAGPEIIGSVPQAFDALCTICDRPAQQHARTQPIAPHHAAMTVHEMLELCALAMQYHILQSQPMADSDLLPPMHGAGVQLWVRAKDRSPFYYRPHCADTQGRGQALELLDKFQAEITTDVRGRYVLIDDDPVGFARFGSKDEFPTLGMAIVAAVARHMRKP